jgi:hypothetical protein
MRMKWLVHGGARDSGRARSTGRDMKLASAQARRSRAAQVTIEAPTTATAASSAPATVTYASAASCHQLMRRSGTMWCCTALSVSCSTSLSGVPSSDCSSGDLSSATKLVMGCDIFCTCTCNRVSARQQHRRMTRWGACWRVCKPAAMTRYHSQLAHTQKYGLRVCILRENSPVTLVLCVCVATTGSGAPASAP